MSAQNFQQELDFVNNVVDGLMLSTTDGFSVGVVVFSQNLQEIALGSLTTKAALRSAVNQLNHDRDGTLTDLAIQRVTESFNAYGRNNVQRIAILLTDGRSKFADRTSSAAAVARANNILMIAVGIGSQINLDEMNSIASRSDLTFIVPDFNALTQLALQIATTVCPSKSYLPSIYSPYTRQIFSFTLCY